MLLDTEERIFIMLPYICNPDQVNKIHTESTTLGDYHFIRKNNERHYGSYRKVDMGVNSPYYVAVSLPGFLFKDLIKSGKVDQLFS